MLYTKVASENTEYFLNEKVSIKNRDYFWALRFSIKILFKLRLHLL